MALKRKATAAIATFSLVALIVSGTFAWTSLNSQKVNEWRGAGSPGTGPGGTLHDDHDNDAGNDQNKQVYVENWGDQDLFVRVLLTEYMEAGQGAGLKSVSTDQSTGQIIHNPDNQAKSITGFGDIDHTNTWQNIWYRFPEAGDPPTGIQSIYKLSSYWNWDMGGQKYYYPASADNRNDKSYVDQNSPDNLTADSVNSAGIQAQQTLSATVMTMAQWKNAGMPIGNYWVIDRTYQTVGSDTTGVRGNWAYWAAPLKPGTATGLLLKNVTLIDTALQKYGPAGNSGNGAPYFDFDKGYYYGINVAAQMATKDGTADGSGLTDNYTRFGDASQGGWTTDGQNLMEAVVASDTGDTPVTPTPPATASANLVVSGGTAILDNIIFAKPGQTVTFTGQTTTDFGVQALYINGAKANAPVDTDNYTITLAGPSISNTLVFKTAAPVGFQLPISAVMPGEAIAYVGPGGAPQYRNGYRYDTSKTAIVIPSDCTDVLKGSDGKFYLSYSNGTYRVFNIDDGTTGPEINNLP